MLSPAAMAVLVALRDLAHANGAAVIAETVKKRGWSAAPSASQLADRAGVPMASLAGLRDELQGAGLITEVCGVRVVTIGGHQRLAEMAGSGEAVA